VTLVAALGIVNTKTEEASAERQAIRENIEQLNRFVLEASTPNEIVLAEPGDEFHFPKAALPMRLSRPTLISYKFIPTNSRGIYRWYDLLQYRERVFDESCKGIDRFPVRYLLMTRRPDMTPPCGEVVWRSEHFVLIEP
jgi:hypothetical protein